MKQFFVLLMLGTLSTQCFSMGDYNDSSNSKRNTPRSSPHYEVSQPTKFSNIEFNRAFADRTDISRAGKAANSDLRWVFNCPRDIDEAYKLIISGERSTPSHIINCAKALRHVQEVTSTNHAKSHYCSTRNILFNSELLTLSKWLISYVIDHFDYSADDKYQLGQTRMHYDELQRILDRKRINQENARNASHEQGSLKDTLEKISIGIDNLSLSKNEILCLKALENKKDKSPIEAELFALYQKIDEDFPEKLEYRSVITSQHRK